MTESDVRQDEKGQPDANRAGRDHGDEPLAHIDPEDPGRVQTLEEHLRGIFLRGRRLMVRPI